MKDHSLIDVLDSLLTDNGFLHMQAIDERLREENPNYRFYGPEEGAHPQYLLILDIDLTELPSSSEFLEMQSTLFQHMVETSLPSTFDKNVSFLLTISNPEGVVLKQNTEDFILQVEEDPYYFKKLVLVYDPDSAKRLAENYKESGQDTQNFFYDQINAQAAFDAFVEGHNPIYKLIAKLCIKLPFIPLPLRDHETPIILSEVLQTKIASEDLLLLWDKVCLSSIGDISSLSLKVDVKELDDILTAWDMTEVTE